MNFGQDALNLCLQVLKPAHDTLNNRLPVIKTARMIHLSTVPTVGEKLIHIKHIRSPPILITSELVKSDLH